MKTLLELDYDQLVMVRDGVDLLQPDTDEAADRQEELLRWINSQLDERQVTVDRPVPEGNPIPFTMENMTLSHIRQCVETLRDMFKWLSNTDADDLQDRLAAARSNMLRLWGER